MLPRNRLRRRLAHPASLLAVGGLTLTVGASLWSGEGYGIPEQHAAPRPIQIGLTAPERSAEPGFAPSGPLPVVRTVAARVDAATAPAGPIDGSAARLAVWQGAPPEAAAPSRADAPPPETAPPPGAALPLGAAPPPAEAPAPVIAASSPGAAPSRVAAADPVPAPAPPAAAAPPAPSAPAIQLPRAEALRAGRPGAQAGPARAVSAALSPLVLGRWVPDREACTNPDGTEFLPLVIGATKATAGDAACRFGARTRRGATWNLVAECTDGSNAWSSKVHLAVAQGRLTWSSEKGVQTYIRCDEDVRVATKRPAKTRAAARSAPKQARPAPVTKPTMRITADDGSVKTWALLKPR